MAKKDIKTVINDIEAMILEGEQDPMLIAKIYNYTGMVKKEIKLEEGNKKYGISDI